MADRDPRALAAELFDALVVGGGAIGAGIARDLALRGLRVVLVERRDWASGTSSRPTRLIHGGLRYLELFDFGLVRADMREREILLHIAPHLVHPLPFLLPIYRRSPLYRAKLWTGMRLYDLLSYDKSLPPRAWLRRPRLLAEEPGLNAEGLRGAWRFYDAQVPLVERLVVENVVDAVANGALAVNYATVERFLREGNRVVGAQVLLEEGQRCAVRARITVNATGPWLDRTVGELRREPRPLLRLTKGVHLVTPSGTRHAHVLFAESDGRLFFVVPWLGYSLIGTTDTDYSGDPGAVAATPDDVEYLLRAASRAFPYAPFHQVYYTWAGVRALVRVEGVREGEVSRKHAIHDHLAQDGIEGVVSVVGGKLTAYRGIAEEVGDLVAQRLGVERRSPTATRLLPGATADHSALKREVAALAADAGLDSQAASHLVTLYGARALEVLELVRRSPELRLPLAPHAPDLLAQVVHAAEREQARHLADLLLRRGTTGFLPDQGLGELETIAERVGAVLGWSPERRREEAERYRAEIQPMRLARPPSRLPGLVAARERAQRGFFRLWHGGWRLRARGWRFRRPGSALSPRDPGRGPRG